MALSAFVLVGGLTWFGGLCVGVARGNRKLAAREEAFQRLVSGDQEQQGPYRTRQLIHDGHCAENVVEQMVCTMRVLELEAKVKELEAKVPKPPTGTMMDWGWREKPKPTSLPGGGSVVWK